MESFIKTYGFFFNFPSEQPLKYNEQDLFRLIKRLVAALKLKRAIDKEEYPGRYDDIFKQTFFLVFSLDPQFEFDSKNHKIWKMVSYPLGSAWQNESRWAYDPNKQEKILWPQKVKRNIKNNSKKPSEWSNIANWKWTSNRRKSGVMDDTSILYSYMDPKYILKLKRLLGLNDIQEWESVLDQE